MAWLLLLWDCCKLSVVVVAEDRKCCQGNRELLRRRIVGLPWMALLRSMGKVAGVVFVARIIMLQGGRCYGDESTFPGALLGGAV